MAERRVRSLSKSKSDFLRTRTEVCGCRYPTKPTSRRQQTTLGPLRARASQSKRLRASEQWVHGAPSHFDCGDIFRRACDQRDQDADELCADAFALHSSLEALRYSTVHTYSTAFRARPRATQYRRRAKGLRWSQTSSPRSHSSCTSALIGWAA